MTSFEEQAMHAAEDVELVNSPKSGAHIDIMSPSTISMVTVRLSDSEPSTLPNKPELQRDDDDHATSQTEHDIESPMDVRTSQHNGSDESRRTSALSGSSKEHGVEVVSGTNASSSPSRRGSSSTTSSDSSTRVDWEELEKTEEQESRDEASDEVQSYLMHWPCRG